MGLRVLSLFDGIACGMQAFKELGIPIDVYYASEIEKNAIKVATSNHPEIIEIGDVTKVNFEDYVGKVDIIIGGSPCQGFSVSGKQLAFLDERSALIKWHTITEEEREGYPKEWVTYLDCEMPADNESILVQTHGGYICEDVCYADGEYSLDSGYDWIEDIVAWMPMPSPWKGDK